MNINGMLAIGIMSIGSPVAAQSWTELRATPERIYFDADAVDRDARHPSIWIKRVNDRGSEILTHERYDCKERTFAITYTTSRYADGRTTDPITTSASIENPVDTDVVTFRGGVYGKLCPAE